MSRPNKGLSHVDGLEGDPETKARLKILLATLSGELLVYEACEELEVGESQFANLRRQMLQAAHDGLKPRPVGWPPRDSEHTDEEFDAMRARIVELERELDLLRTRLELAILPLLQPPRQRRSKRRGQTQPAAAPPRATSSP